eukprot:615297-Alexandrium_andersonii.AAC.1
MAARRHRRSPQRRGSRRRLPSRAVLPQRGAPVRQGCAQPRPGWQRTGGRLGTNQQPIGSSAACGVRAAA